MKKGKHNFTVKKIKKDKEKTTQATSDDFSFGFAFGSFSFDEFSVALPESRQPEISTFTFDDTFGDFNFGTSETSIQDSSLSVSTTSSEEIKQTSLLKPKELINALQKYYKKQANTIRLPISGYSFTTEAGVSLIVDEKFQQLQHSKQSLEDKIEFGSDNRDSKLWDFNPQETKKESEQKVETPIILENIFIKKEKYSSYFSFGNSYNDKPVNRILVEVSLNDKSASLPQCLTYLWANNPAFFKMKNFKYVIFVPLRLWLAEKIIVKTTLSAHLAAFLYEHCLSQILEKEDDGILETLQAVLSPGGDRYTLLILDGYHEVAHLLEDESSVGAQLLKSALGFKQVLVTTSSQQKPSQDMGSFDNELRIIGYQEDQIKIFLQNYFDWQVMQVESKSSAEEKHKKDEGGEEIALSKSQNMSRQLTKALKQSPQILEVVSNPLILAFFCEIYGSQLPSLQYIPPLVDLSLTTFYNKIAESYLKRYWQKHQKHLFEFYDFTTLRTPYFVEMEALGILAWQSFQNNEIIFSETTITNTLKQLSQHFLDRNTEACFANAQELGFLRVEPNVHKSSLHQSCCFIHSTFQEYFAAYHLLQNLQGYYSKVVYEESIDWIARHKYEPHNARVMGFLAGLTLHRGYDQALKAFWYAVLSPPHDIMGAFHVQLVMRCLHEAQLDERVPERDKLFSLMKKWTERIGYNPMKWFVDFLCAYPILIRQKEIVELLIKDSRLQESKVEALGKIGAIVTSSEIVTFLFKALENKERGIRSSAAQSLRQIGEIDPETEGLISGLLQALQEEDDDYAIIEALSGVGKVSIRTKEIVAGLLEFIQDKENKSRHYAVQALGQIGTVAPTEGLVASLLELLQDDGHMIGKAAATALSQISLIAPKTKGLVQGLLQALKKEKNEVVCVEILTALGSIGMNYPLKEIVADIFEVLQSKIKFKEKSYSYCSSNIPKAAILALTQIAMTAPETEGLIPGLLQGLQDKDIRNDVSDALCKIGVLAPETKGLISGLFQGLRDENKDVRATAVKILGDIGSFSPIEGLVEELIPLLQDHDADVRTEVARSLDKVSDIIPATTELATCLFQAMYKERKWHTQKCIVDALKKICKVKPSLGGIISSGLLTALQDEVTAVRQSAAYAIGQVSSQIFISKETLESSLLMLLEDDEDEVRRQVVLALGQMEVTSLSKEVLVKALLRALQTSQDGQEEEKIDPWFRQRKSLSEEIIIVLGKTGVIVPQTEGLIDNLLEALRGKNSHVKRQAAEALGQIGAALLTEKLIAGLLEALQDKENNWLKHTVVRSLGKICRIQTTKSLVSDLLRILNEEKNEEICITAISILGSIGVNYPLIEEVAAVLMQTLQSKVIKIRQEAGYSLWRIGLETSMTKKIVSCLLQLLLVKKKNVVGQYEAVTILGKIGMQAPSNKELVQGLLQALHSKKDDIQKAAASALGHIALIAPLTEGLIIGLLRLQGSDIGYDLRSHVEAILLKVFKQLSTVFSWYLYFSNRIKQTHQQIDSVWLNWIKQYLSERYPGIILHSNYLQLITGTGIETVAISDMAVMQPLLDKLRYSLPQHLTLENCLGKTALYPAAKKPNFKSAGYPKPSTEFKSFEKDLLTAISDKKSSPRQNLSFLFNSSASSSSASLVSASSSTFIPSDISGLSIYPSMATQSISITGLSPVIKTSPPPSSLSAPITHTKEEAEKKGNQVPFPAIAAYTPSLFSSQPSTSVDLITSKAWQVFQKKLQQLKENDYTFTVQKPKEDQLLMIFARDTVLSKKEKIIDELVDTIEALQILIVDNGITAQKPKFKPNWEQWTLTLQAAPMIIYAVHKLLKDVMVMPSTSDSEIEICRMQ